MSELGDLIGECEISGSIMRVRRTPYVRGELVLVALQRTANGGFHGYLHLATADVEFVAISHLWLDSSVEDKVETESELSWTLVHALPATGPLNDTLTALCDDSHSGEVVIWMDFLCLPQSTSFNDKPEIFLSMSSVYGQSARCVLIPICDTSALANWDGEFDKLSASVVEAERSTRCKDWLEEAAGASDVCDTSYALDLMRIVDTTRRSYVSKDGWRGMGHVPYKFMRDAFLLLQLADLILQSEYFFRVWCFQEVILPAELYISFGRYGPLSRSNVIDTDAFVALTNMARATLANIDASISVAHETTAPYKAFVAAKMVLLQRIRGSVATLDEGRSIGRTSKLELQRRQLSSRYVEDVLRVFASAPRRCRYNTDFVFGLLGLIPVDIKRDDAGVEVVVRRFMAEISRRTRRVWVSGGFVKLLNPLKNWWVSNVPRDARDSTCLKGSRPIADFDPTKPLGETFGAVSSLKGMEITSNFSLVVGEPEMESGTATYRLKHVVCADHQLVGGASKMEQRGLDVIELSLFLHAMIMRLGMGGAKFAESAMKILGFKISRDKDEKEEQAIQRAMEYDSHIRREMYHYLRSLDEEETASSYLSGGQMPTNMLVTDEELIDLFGGVAEYNPTLRLGIDVVCGCKFGCPDSLFLRIMELSQFSQISSLLNLSAMQCKEERLIICEVDVLVKTDVLSRLFEDPDKKKHAKSLQVDERDEHAGGLKFKSANESRLDRVVRIMRGYQTYGESKGILLSLRDEKAGPMKPQMEYVQLIERGRKVYAARSSRFENSEYQPLGVFVFAEDIHSKEFVEKLKKMQDGGEGADGKGAGNSGAKESSPSAAGAPVGAAPAAGPASAPSGPKATPASAAAVAK
ncbi:hypothetical protein BC830DRAFT_1155601 [Chytriomyces sp. MP71]|nr:hypothetical protein BC830DRAFT_1155601 [Chytriomyces sp. MP71]